MRTCHFTIDRRQKRAFYLTVVRSIFEHCSCIWHPISDNQIAPFDSIQKRAIKWILGDRFNHYSDEEYFNNQKKLCILPIKQKFVLNDLVLFFKIINNLVAITLPSEFKFIKADQLKYTHVKTQL